MFAGLQLDAIRRSHFCIISDAIECSNLGILSGAKKGPHCCGPFESIGSIDYGDGLNPPPHEPPPFIATLATSDGKLDDEYWQTPLTTVVVSGAVTVMKTVVLPFAPVVPLVVVMVPPDEVTVHSPLMVWPLMPFPFASSNVSETGSVVGVVVPAGTLGHAVFNSICAALMTIGTVTNVVAPPSDAP